MSILLVILMLVLPLPSAVLIVRSQWGRRMLAYACIGLATAMPLWLGGCAKPSDRQQTLADAERDSDPTELKQAATLNALANTKANPRVGLRIAVKPSNISIDQLTKLATDTLANEQADALGQWHPLDRAAAQLDSPDTQALLRQLIEQTEAEDLQSRTDAATAIAFLFAEADLVVREQHGELWVLLNNEPTKSITLGQNARVLEAAVRLDEIQQVVVAFKLDESGGKRMRSLTGEHLGDKLALLVDGRVVVAATIQAVLGSDVQLTGRLTEPQADRIARHFRETHSGRSP